MTLKPLNIRGDNCYSCNDLVNLKNFDPSMIKLERSESVNGVFIYHVNYSGKHPLRLCIKELDGYFTEEKHEGWSNKYLNIALIGNNDVLMNYAKVWKTIGDKISDMCNGLEGEYEYYKDLMKITVNTDNDLPLNKVIKFHVLVFNIRHVFKNSNKCSPHIFLADCLYDNV